MVTEVAGLLDGFTGIAAVPLPSAELLPALVTGIIDLVAVNTPEARDALEAALPEWWVGPSFLHELALSGDMTPRDGRDPSPKAPAVTTIWPAPPGPSAH